MLPPVWLGVWQSCAYFYYFLNSLPVTGGGGSCLKTPTVRLELNLFRSLRAPSRGPAHEAGLAGVRQAPSEGAPDSETFLGLDPRSPVLAWVGLVLQN